MKIAKLKEQARKFELKDQFDKAIKAYLKVLEELEGTPELEDELSIYNKVGDLYLKKKDANSAVEMYETAAEHYKSSGFPNNAIALYNKVLRCAPTRTDAYLRLGELMVGRGFAAEARKNFDQYFERMERDNRLDTAFSELKTIADNSEDNEELRLMLAEHLKAAARTDDAREQLAALYAETSAGGDERKSRATLDKMQAIDPDFQPDAPATAGGRSRKKQQAEIVFLDLESGEEEVLAPVDEVVPDALGGDEEVAVVETDEVLSLEDAGATESEPVDGLETVEAFESPEDGVTVIDEDSAASGEGAFGEDDLITQTALDSTGSDARVTDDLIDLDSSSGEDVLELESSEALELDGAEEQTPADDLELLGVTGDDSSDYEGVGMDLALDANPGERIGDEMELVLDRPGEVDLEVESVGLDVDDSDSVNLDDLILEVAAGPSIEELRDAVTADPDDGDKRHDYAEALIELGDTETGINELAGSAASYDAAGDSGRAVTVTDELIRLDTNNTAHYRKKVELLSRMGDKDQLVAGYLAYADALLRTGDMDGARTAYLNVLEHDSDNQQAQTALETVVPDQPVAAPAEPEAGGSDFIDLGELIFGDEDSEMDTRMTADSAEQTGDEDADFNEMLGQFKKGIEENIEEDDSEAHYDLGVAFKEMGLLDEAIGEFQKALRGSSSRLKASEALGACFFEKDQWAVASTVLKRAIDADAGGDDVKIGLLYWLGRSDEEQGKKAEALESYQRVFAVDINFQDVGERVANLG